MKTIICDQPARVGDWVCARVGGKFNLSDSWAIGLEKGGQLIAGVVFDTWLGNSIAMHVAGEGGHWMTREFAKVCFTYAFIQLKVKKVLGFVDSTNTKARRYDEHLGFQLEHVIKDAGKFGDICIYSMTADQCRFIKEDYGLKKQRSAASA